MLATSPVSEYVVDVEPVFDCMTDHVVPLSVDRSIMYPVIAEPPLLAGPVQDRLIPEDEIALAASPVGDPGTVAVLLLVVADVVFDGELEPIALIADTR